MKQSKQHDNVVFVPLGGTGEIGMNLNLYGIGAGVDRDWLMVDIGITFGGEEEPGIDIIVPDIEFILPFKERIKALVLTHGHEDHIGAVGWLYPYLNCPIYATAFTAELVKEKLSYWGIDNADLNIIPLGGRIDLDPFTVEMVNMTHSIAEPQALVIECEQGRIFHTGDWKIDSQPPVGKKMDVEKLKDIGKQGIDVMVCDSTNILESGESGLEITVKNNLQDVVERATGRVVITSFASNVARLHSIGEIAKSTNRQLLLLGRGMYRIYNAARKTGYLKDFPVLLDADAVKEVPANKLLVFCTGSQGEENAALASMLKKNPQITLEKDDMVIFSSRVIPGNEKLVMRLQGQLIDKGVELVTANRENGLHVSGHPNREELRQMYEWISPVSAIPVHGEIRHLQAHVDFIRTLDIKGLQARNGDMIEVLPQVKKLENVISGRMYCDGNILISQDDNIIKTRRNLSSHGVVFISLVLNEDNTLFCEPVVSTLGIPEYSNQGERLDVLVYDAIKTCSIEGEYVTKKLDKKIKQAVRKSIRYVWGKSPEVVINILKL